MPSNRESSDCIVIGADLIGLSTALHLRWRGQRVRVLELKRQGGWQRWEQVERYSHAVPPQDRRTLPNAFDPQKSAAGQLPSARVSRLFVSA